MTDHSVSASALTERIEHLMYSHPFLTFALALRQTASEYDLTFNEVVKILDDFHNKPTQQADAIGTPCKDF